MADINSNGGAAAPERPREDRIFQLIERHKAALAARAAAEAADDNDAYEKAYYVEAQLHRQLFATRPTTLDGAEAFASHVAWMPGLAELDGEHFSAVRAMRTLSVALLNIMQAPGGSAASPRRRMRDFDVGEGKCRDFRIGGEE